ncbi:MAG: septum formation inhibitor Maf [Opitutales bacterium]
MKCSHRIFTALGVSLFAGVLLFELTGCSRAQSADGTLTISGPEDTQAFEQYWFHQGAEISRFRLVQSRYGDAHDGDLTLVYVTEPFNPRAQVKADDPNAQNPTPIPVLKLNLMRAFNTGLYRYNVMKSIFAPTDLEAHPLPLKVTHSVQDWCGQTFSQMNRTDEGYRLRTFSYFETEGDADVTLEDVVPEDAIWTLIRLDPQQLPSGNFKMARGLFNSRVAHRDVTPLAANGALTPMGDDLLTYTVRIPDEQRTLTWRFESAFPWRIEYFSDDRAGHPKTEAFREETIFSWYWTENRPSDASKRRDTLGYTY